MDLEPISFDTEAVAEARRQCRRMASALAVAADARRHDADRARDDWVGRWRDDFDRRLAALDAAVDDVEHENRRRAAARAELAALRADVGWLAAEPAVHRHRR